jgi:hypothetical protein
MSAAFQIGYYNVIGLEFLSFASPSDWLFIASASSFLMGIVSIVAISVEGLIATLQRIIKRLGEHRVEKWAWVFWVALLCLTATSLTFGVLAVVVISIFGMHSILHKAKETGTILISQVLYAFAMLCCVAYGLGMHQGYTTSKSCNLTLDQGRFERAEYLRFVGEGHLVRMGGRTHFIPKSEVKEMWCGEFKP